MGVSYHSWTISKSTAPWCFQNLIYQRNRHLKELLLSITKFPFSLSPLFSFFLPHPPFFFFFPKCCIRIDTLKLFWVTKFLLSESLKSWKEPRGVNQFNTLLLHWTETKWSKLLLPFFKKLAHACTHTFIHSHSPISFTWLDCPSNREKNNVHWAPRKVM